jgi:hypothetical protein
MLLHVLATNRKLWPPHVGNKIVSKTNFIIQVNTVFHKVKCSIRFQAKFKLYGKYTKDIYVHGNLGSSYADISYKNIFHILTNLIN